MKKTFTFIPLTALITTLLTTPANACAIGSGVAPDRRSTVSLIFEDDPEILFILILFVVFIVKAISGVIKLRSDSPARIHVEEQIQAAIPELSPINDYIRYDSSFAPSEFKEKLSNLYVQLQNNWQKKDLSPLRPYFTEELYDQMDRQLQRFRDSHVTNCIERIAVLGVDIMGWKRENDTDVIKARLNTRTVDYVKNDRTGAVIRGSDKKEKFVTYEWTLIRKTGTSTKRLTGTVSLTCPYCGANVDIEHSAVCEYCGSILHNDTFAWALSSIRSISQ